MENTEFNNFKMHSDQINELMDALSKAQLTMRGALTDSLNPYFKSKYADLSNVWEACREPLTRNGLSIAQVMQPIDGKLCLVSILGHKSGQWIKSLLPIKTSKDDIQALGSAITYSRRYALAALVGVCPTDDDGESTMDRESKKEDKKPEMKLDELLLPSDISKEHLSYYITECARLSKNKEGYVIHKASSNLNKFLESFKEWESKHFTPAEKINLVSFAEAS